MAIKSLFVDNITLQTGRRVICERTTAHGQFIPSPCKHLVGDSHSGNGLVQHGDHGRFAVRIPLRADFDAAGLRTAARLTKDAAQARRLLALAVIYDGALRTEAARISGVTLQIERGWTQCVQRVAVQRRGPGRAGRPQGAGPGVTVERRAAKGAIDLLKGVSTPAWKKPRASRASPPEP